MSRLLLRSLAFVATFILVSSATTSVQPQGQVEPAMVAGHHGLSHRVHKLEHKVHKLSEILEFTTEREYDLTLSVDGHNRRYEFTTIRGPGAKGDKTELIVHRIAGTGDEKKYDLTFRPLIRGRTSHEATKDYRRLAIRHDMEDHKTLLDLRHRLHTLDRKMIKLRSMIEHTGDKIFRLIVRTIPMMGSRDPIMKWEFHTVGKFPEKFEVVILPIPTTTEGDRRFKIVIHPILYTKDMPRDFSDSREYDDEYLIQDIQHKLTTLEPMVKRLLQKAKLTKEKSYGLVIRTTPNVMGLEPVMNLKFNAVEEDDKSFALDVRQVAGIMKEGGEEVKTYKLSFHGSEE